MTTDPSFLFQGAIVNLIQVVLIMIGFGVCLWLVNRYIPMNETIKNLVNAVVIIGIVLWLLKTFGILAAMSVARVGR